MDNVELWRAKVNAIYYTYLTRKKVRNRAFDCHFNTVPRDLNGYFDKIPKITLSRSVKEFTL